MVSFTKIFPESSISLIGDTTVRSCSGSNIANNSRPSSLPADGSSNPWLGT